MDCMLFFVRLKFFRSVSTGMLTIFLSHDMDKAINMKFLLCVFEQLSGLKINYHKSEIYCFGKAKDAEMEYSHLFGCRTGEFPFRYLGIPMHFRKLSTRDWKVIEERFEKNLAGWKGKLLSVGGQLVLINSVLSSLPMFMMSFFQVPKGVLKKLDYYRSRFYWKNDQLKWEIICQPKQQGGLGLQNLEIQNTCLLSKWLYKLCNEEGMWQSLLRNKYLRNKTLWGCSKKATDSQFWKGLMNVKDHFLRYGSFKVENGAQIRFWEDTWLGGSPSNPSSQPCSILFTVNKTLWLKFVTQHHLMFLFADP